MAGFDIVLVQLNTLVGDIDGNTSRVLAAVERAQRELDAPLLVFPELTVCGYPPEDLLLRPAMDLRVGRALERLCAGVDSAHVVVGYPRLRDGRLCNMAGVIHRGALVAEYAKQLLPNYQVFDEKRYFEPGDAPCVVDVCGVPVGITICEDIWEPGPAAAAVGAGARLLLNLSASPFHRGKPAERRELIARLAAGGRMPVVYVNQVGGQDELVFDGGSFAVDAGGELCAAAPCYEEAELRLRAEPVDGGCKLHRGDIHPAPDDLDSVYGALVLGTRDYVDKNGFKGVVLGLSGGIDSALTLAVAADALGPERVEAVMMPFRHTAPMSMEDAAEESRRLGVRHGEISIEPLYRAFEESLAAEFGGPPADITGQNIQARARGVLLMAISNQRDYLVLTTGNKSELAVGYSTLYGDMAGGFDVLKDVPKTLVYELARHRNRRSPVIPERVIERAPSAELAPGQEDQDSLPPYDMLDRILELYIEQDLGADAIVETGLDRGEVERVIRMVDRNEYKRRQAPVGVRITRRGFGRDRRYPVTSAWEVGD